MRTTLSLIALSVVLLGGCGDDAPSRDEFVDSLMTSFEEDAGDDLPSGEDGEKAKAVIEGYAGCIYDEISDDSELVKDLMDNPDDVSEERMEPAEACTADFQDEIMEIMGGTTETSTP